MAANVSGDRLEYKEELHREVFPTHHFNQMTESRISSYNCSTALRAMAKSNRSSPKRLTAVEHQPEKTGPRNISSILLINHNIAGL